MTFQKFKFEFRPVPKCKFKDFIRDNFEMHIRTQHKELLYVPFECIYCALEKKLKESGTHQTKCSNILEFNCVYCLHRSEKSEDMQLHFKTNHFDSIPLFCKRELKPEPTHSSKVVSILLLIIDI